MTSLLLVAGVGIGAGLFAWAVRRVGNLGLVVAIVGLLIVAALAVALPSTAADPGAATDVAPAALGEPMAITGYLRLFVVAAAVSGILFALLWAVEDGAAVSPGAAFAALAGASALCLALLSPVVALLPATGAALAGYLAIDRGRGPAGVHTARDGYEPETGLGGDPIVGRRLGLEALRIAIGLALAVTATEIVVGRADTIAGSPFGVGLATLGIGGAAALRLGAVPFHVHVPRLAEARIGAAQPVLSVWGPIVFGLAALAALQSAVLPLALPLSLERGILAGLAIITIVAGGLGALLHDDLDHVVAYWIVHDLGFAVLAFAAGDSSVWGPARAWLLIVAVTKTALLGWSLATGRTFGTRSLLELRGWARRAPLLAAGLALIALGSFGLPGLAAFDARSGLVRAALVDPIRVVVSLLLLVTLAIVVRLFAVGLDHPTALVQSGPVERLRSPAPDLRRRVGATAREWRDLNRAPLAAAIVVGLGLVAAGVGGGLFDVTAASAADAPAPFTIVESPAPGPTFQPVPTESPTPAPPSPTVRPTATAKPTTPARPSATPRVTPRPTAT